MQELARCANKELAHFDARSTHAHAVTETAPSLCLRFGNLFRYAAS